ncbi:MAG: hypothetical protein KatS3mg095_0629 [Candidatus Parcubacteria bacterium]|nr:MAG: hypothetical protein KatS3mg095_0629 [Candidatus Parcubacteria bacterium]
MIYIFLVVSGIVILFSFFIIILIFLFLIYSVYLETILRNSSFSPTKINKYRKQFEILFDFLESLDLKNKKFVDLGSGDGGIVVEFVKHNYQSYGVEINPSLIFWSKLRARKLKNIFFIRKNIFKINLRDFGIVYLYRLSSTNKKLLPKFENELSIGSVIVSHRFALPQSDKIKLIKIIGNNDLLVYQKK